MQGWKWFFWICFKNCEVFMVEGDRTFIGTPRSDVFELGIWGLTLFGSGNSFFLISGRRDLLYLNLGPQDFVFLNPGFRDHEFSWATWINTLKQWSICIYIHLSTWLNQKYDNACGMHTFLCDQYCFVSCAVHASMVSWFLS